jgi:hypothetical protein
MIFDRAGAGPVAERRFMVTGLHAPGEPTAVVVTYSAPPDSFDAKLSTAKNLVAKPISATRPGEFAFGPF